MGDSELQRLTAVETSLGDLHKQVDARFEGLHTSFTRRLDKLEAAADRRHTEQREDVSRLLEQLGAHNTRLVLVEDQCKRCNDEKSAARGTKTRILTTVTGSLIVALLLAIASCAVYGFVARWTHDITNM
jgi:hypothetical protein